MIIMTHNLFFSSSLFSPIFVNYTTPWFFFFFTSCFSLLFFSLSVSFFRSWYFGTTIWYHFPRKLDNFKDYENYTFKIIDSRMKKKLHILFLPSHSLSLLSLFHFLSFSSFFQFSWFLEDFLRELISRNFLWFEARKWRRNNLVERRREKGSERERERKKEQQEVSAN